MAVTNMSLANIPFWGCLPMMHTNYGGDTQISTIPSYAGYNLGLSFNPMAQATWGMPGLSMGQFPQMPPINQQAVIAGAQALLTPALNNLTSSNINLCINNIASTKARLQAAMQAESTTEEQRNQIQTILDKLKVQEDKLQEIKTSTDLDPQTAYQKVSEIEAEVNKIVRDAIKLLSNNTKPADASQDTDTDETVDGADGADGTDSADGTDDSVEGTGSADSSTETNPQGNTNVDEFSKDVQAAVDQAYDAMYCVGTDEEALEEVLNLVNKDDVMNLMLAWNKYHSGEKGESFMTAFMWDADSDQKEKYGKAIARALREKAEELGIYDECAADFAAIDKEMGSWFYISNDIAEKYDAIIEKIAAKMGSKYGKVQTVAAEK